MSNDISLLTTLRYVPTSPSGIPLLRRHLDRLSRAADCFGEGSGQYEYGGDEVLREKIQETCEGKVVGDWRVRVVVDRQGAVDVGLSVMPLGSDTFQYDLPSSSSPKTAPKTVYLDPIALNPTLDDRLWTYKTTERGAYQEAMQRASRDAQERGHEPPFDVLLRWRVGDTDGDVVTESSTSNIAVYDPQPSLPDWVTPVYTLRAPFLRGTMRSELMDRGLLREEVITVGRLRRWVEEGREVVGMNGLRGIWRMKIALG